MKKAFALVAILVLSGCLYGCSSTDIVKTLGTAEKSFTRSVNQADVIAQRPRCPAAEAVLCVEQSDVNDMVSGVEVGDQALDKAWEAFRAFANGSGTEAALDAALTAALGATDVFETIVKKFVKE